MSETEATAFQPSPATLVAIIVAARRSGDRELEREMRRRLQEKHGIKVQIAQIRTQVGETP